MRCLELRRELFGGDLLGLGTKCLFDATDSTPTALNGMEEAQAAQRSRHPLTRHGSATCNFNKTPTNGTNERNELSGSPVRTTSTTGPCCLVHRALHRRPKKNRALPRLVSVILPNRIARRIFPSSPRTSSLPYLHLLLTVGRSCDNGRYS